MITAGAPLGEAPTFVEDAVSRVRKESNTGKIVFFTVAVEGADIVLLMKILKMGSDRILRLDGLKFNGLFVWLSRSVQAPTTKQTGGKFFFLPKPWAKK